MKWTCPGCGGVINCRSPSTMDKWVSNHKDTCPRYVGQKEKK